MPTINLSKFSGKVLLILGDEQNALDKYFMRIEDGEVTECKIAYTKDTKGVEKQFFKFIPKCDLEVTIHNDENDKNIPVIVKYQRYFFIDRTHSSFKPKSSVDYGTHIAQWAFEMYLNNRNIGDNTDKSK